MILKYDQEGSLKDHVYFTQNYPKDFKSGPMARIDCMKVSQRETPQVRKIYPDSTEQALKGMMYR